jgi:hypothetical protein
VIKTAAGIHHVLRGNYAGALKVLGDVPRLLEAYRPRTMGLDVDRLLGDVERVTAAVRALGPERTAEFDRELVPRLETGDREQETGDRGQETGDASSRSS